FPGETSWNLTNTCTGSMVAFMPPKTLYTSRETPYSINWCLPLAAYKFTITDTSGDGVCCDWGSGSYSVTYGGNLVASGGQFGRSESATFGSCGRDPTANPTTMPSAQPAPPARRTVAPSNPFIGSMSPLELSDTPSSFVQSLHPLEKSSYTLLTNPQWYLKQDILICRQNCDGSPPCGGASEPNNALYDSAEACCNDSYESSNLAERCLDLSSPVNHFHLHAHIGPLNHENDSFKTEDSPEINSAGSQLKHKHLHDRIPPLNHEDEGSEIFI
ncbi:hypothetical protein ACHAXR_002484, partial [Thalassiosira sp. AJA248-18]